MSKKINLVVLWMLDYEGKKFLTGGLERWCRDCALFFAEQGYSVTIYQKGNEFFTIKYFENITIKGIKCSLNFYGNFTFSNWLTNNTDTTEPFIFVSHELALSKKIKNSIAVNHGIYWDGDFPIIKKILNKFLQKHLINNVKAIICVDTNYINWCHAELKKRELWQQKLFYLHNYADLTLFNNNKKKIFFENTYPIILFPRRVSGDSLKNDGRGAGFLLEAFKELHRTNIKTNILFCGRGTLQNQITQWGHDNSLSEFIKVIDVPLDDMPQIYNSSDIVVVPTIEHEGTSLSAIEGICAGKPVIVTHIGGLPNIIINNLNGIVINLNKDELVNAITQEITNKFKIDNNIINKSKIVFSKTSWQNKLKNIFDKYISV